jgi:hypothetical protein
MIRKLLVPVVAAIVLANSAVATQRARGQALAAQSAKQAPIFEVQPGWLVLPNNWVMGVVSAVAVDRRDHIWILHRPRSGVPDGNKNLVAPPVLEFDAAGTFVQAWGGPTSEYEWPDREHAIYVDSKDNVWLAGTARPPGGPGTGRSDDMVLKLTTAGKLVLQIGRRGQSGGAKDTKNTYGAADLFVYRKTNELFVGDEGNLRVIVFDADTGAFKRMWTAFGNTPFDRPRPGVAAATTSAPPPSRPALDTEGPGSPQFGETHSVRVSNDGLVYVADRPNRRIQVFTLEGKYVAQVFINRNGPANVSAVGIEFSPDPEQRFMYVADSGNNHLVVMERKTLDVLYQFGDKSARPGDFQGIHYLAVDSKGNLYVNEVEPGNRIQKFVFKGLSSSP